MGNQTLNAKETNHAIRAKFLLLSWQAMTASFMDTKDHHADTLASEP
ncbi:hypothetical protein [Phenylobacterium sp.]